MDDAVNPAKFWASVDAAPADKFVGSFEVDWGRKARGQGKRAGRMVMGAMSDAPTGKKVYANILAKAPLTVAESAEASLMEPLQRALIAKALAAGCGADIAFLVAYTVGHNPIPREEAFVLIRDLLDGRM